MLQHRERQGFGANITQIILRSNVLKVELAIQESYSNEVVVKYAQAAGAVSQFATAMVGSLCTEDRIMTKALLSSASHASMAMSFTTRTSASAVAGRAAVVVSSY